MENIPHLFTTRKEVEQFNLTIFENAHHSCKIVINAIDWVIGSASDNVKAQVLSHVPKDPSKTMGLSERLKLAINVPAEITNNVSVKDGITNGASCIVKKFDFRVQNSSRVSIVWVQFDDKNIGQEQRTEYARLYGSGIDKNWTPILEITRIFTIKLNGSFQVKRRQFPVQLAAVSSSVGCS